MKIVQLCPAGCQCKINLVFFSLCILTFWWETLVVAQSSLFKLWPLGGEFGKHYIHLLGQLAISLTSCSQNAHFPSWARGPVSFHYEIIIFILAFKPQKTIISFNPIHPLQIHLCDHRMKLSCLKWVPHQWRYASKGRRAIWWRQVGNTMTLYLWILLSVFSGHDPEGQIISTTL